MVALNFPKYQFRFREQEKPHIFDLIRRKFVLLTPEEWVRQHVVNFLINEKKYPKSLINVEKLIMLNAVKKRYDVVVYNSDGSIRLLVECKAPEVKISQVVFDQIARYNLALQADLMMVTNGLEHFYCQINYAESRYHFLQDLPAAGQSYRIL
jgi:hypothetical protein